MRSFTIAAIALVAGFSGAAAWDLSGVGGESTRDYLLAHPEVLPEAMDVLRQRETLARLEPLRGEIEAPYPGAVLGNPQGSITLVEFTDYACTYCRASVEHVNALIATNPDLRVVIREYPILSTGSVDAARMALAAAEQGKFAEFHQAMFEQDGPSDETIEAAARIAGVDLERARGAIGLGLFEDQLRNNVFLAQSMGLTGTPSWIVGDEVFSGAVGPERIGEAIAEARDS